MIRITVDKVHPRPTLRPPAAKSAPHTPAELLCLSMLALGWLLCSLWLRFALA